MNPSKVKRDSLKKLTDLPNIGPAMADDLHLLGIQKPTDLIGKCPFEMYQRLCDTLGTRIDPCVLDVFISITRFIDGGKSRPWWEYTGQRKRLLDKTAEKETGKRLSRKK